MTLTSPVQEWLAPNSVNQILADPCVGKTTVLKDLGMHWNGKHFAWMFTLGELRGHPHKSRTKGLGFCVSPNLDVLFQNLKTIHEQGIGEEALIIIDDVPVWKSGDPTKTRAPGSHWAMIVELLRRMGSTVVLAGSPDRTGWMKYKSLTYSSSRIFTFEELVRTDDGVVVEVATTKDKMGRTGTVGRVWVRPQFNPAVCLA